MGSLVPIGGGTPRLPQSALPPPPPPFGGAAQTQFGPQEVGRDPRLALTEAGIKQKRVTLPNGRTVLAGYTDADMAKARGLGVAPGQGGNQQGPGAGAAAAGAGGTGAAGSGAGAGAGTGGGGTSVSSEISPYLRDQLKRYSDRFGSDTTDRAVQDSTLQTMDAAALAAADAKGSLSGRGVLGTGTADTYNRKHFFDPAQRLAASNSAQIQIARQKQLDDLVLGGTSLVTAPDAIASENNRIAILQQGQATDQAERAREFDANQTRNQYQDWMQLYGPMLYGQYGSLPSQAPSY